jgi:hypothetical protein
MADRRSIFKFKAGARAATASTSKSKDHRVSAARSDGIDSVAPFIRRWNDPQDKNVCPPTSDAGVLVSSGQQIAKLCR